MLTTVNKLLEHLRIDRRDLIRDGLLVWNSSVSYITPTPSYETISAATVRVVDGTLTLEHTLEGSSTSTLFTLSSYASLTLLVTAIEALDDGWKAQTLAHPDIEPTEIIPIETALDVLGYSARYPMEVTDFHWATALIERTTDWLERLCHRTFESETLTELYDGTGTTLLPLRSYPVTSVTSVEVTEPVGSLEYEPVYTEDLTQGLLWTQNIWPMGWQNVEVVYVAGYATVPDELQNLCCEIAGIFYFKCGENPRVVSDKLGSYSRIMIEEDLPSGVVERIALWKRVEPVFGTS